MHLHGGCRGEAGLKALGPCASYWGSPRAKVLDSPAKEPSHSPGMPPAHWTLARALLAVHIQRAPVETASGVLGLTLAAPSLPQYPSISHPRPRTPAATAPLPPPAPPAPPAPAAPCTAPRHVARAGRRVRWTAAASTRAAAPSGRATRTRRARGTWHCGARAASWRAWRICARRGTIP